METYLFRIILVLPLFIILIDYGILIEAGPAHNNLFVDAKKNKFMINSKVGELDYSKYLLEVFDVLRYEPGLQKELNEENIKSGKLAEHLGNIHEEVRTQLDELKRLELYRVRQLGEELKSRGHHEKEVKSTLKAKTKHLDLKQMTQFSTEDLRKLLLETNAQLAILDEERRERFKEYEMHKLLEFEELLKRLSPLEQMEVRAKMDEMLQTHVRAKPMHMPVSKQHLLKVWEEKDKMEKENFNVKTFFHLHDLDGNGFMDEYEIKMLLKTQVLDHYDESDPDFDEREMNEEMERMREYAFTVIDTDQDHLVSLDEFIVNSKRTGFEEHLFWENVKALPLYTEEEYQEYVHANQKEVNQMIDDKLIKLDLSGIVQHIIKDAGKIMKKRFNL